MAKSPKKPASPKSSKATPTSESDEPVKNDEATQSDEALRSDEAPENAEAPESDGTSTGDGGPKGGGASVSQLLLGAVRDQLDQLESDLSEREQRLVQAEGELTRATSGLKAERTKLRNERDQLEQEVEGRLRASVQQIEEYASTVAERDGQIEAHATREQELTARVESLTQERDRAAAELTQAQQQLTEAQREFGDVRHELDEQGQRLRTIEQELSERERELAERDQRLAEMEQARGQAAAELTEAQQQLAEAQREFGDARHELDEQGQRLHTVEQELSERERELAERDERLAEMAKVREAAETDAAEAREAYDALLRIRAASLERPWLSTAITIGVVGLVVSLGLGRWEYSRYEPMYRAIGVVTVPPGDSDTLYACRDEAASRNLANVHADLETGLLELVAENADPLKARAQVNDVGQSIASRFASGSAETAPAEEGPALAVERERLAERVGEIGQRFTQLARQATDAADDRGAALLESWSKAQGERVQVDASLAALGGESGDGPNEAQLQIDPARLKAAERADLKLQADTEALTQKAAAFDGLLHELLAKGEPSFGALAEAATAGDARVGQALEEDHNQNIQSSLQTIRASIAEWSKAASAMAAVWGEQRGSLTAESSKADPLACQEKIDAAARRLIDDTSAAQVAFDEALEAIGQDNEEMTKGQVLRRRLTQELQGLLEARRAAESAARSLMLTGNLDLRTMVPQVKGLRQRVREQRSLIEAGLRRQLLAELRSVGEEKIRAEREVLTRRAGDLDQIIDKCMADAREMIRGDDQQGSALTEAVELGRELADLVKTAAEGEQSAARRHADAAEPAVAVHYVPVRVPYKVSVGKQLTRGLLVGAISMLVCVLAGAGLHIVRSSRRSKGTIEAYTRELQAASRRGADDDQLNVKD